MDEIVLVSVMPAGGWLEQDSMHSLGRAKERAGLNKKRAVKMMNLARERGISSEKCKWSVDRKYLENRSNEKTVALAYNGYCFIMERASMNCITMHKLPRYFGRKKTFYGDSPRQSRRYDFACA